MHGKSVSPLTLSGKPQFMMWYQQFHSATRSVSMALMKSHRPCAVVTQISWAPMPFISGMARFGKRLLRLGQEFIAVGVDGREVFGQECLGGLCGGELA